jgi:multiple sugar transport system substrate-binding protein/sn-glycerol 3-phosphate transport system substrate-binding protein
MKFARGLALLIVVALAFGFLSTPAATAQGKYVNTVDIKLADITGDYAGLDLKGTKVVWWHQHTGAREEAVKALVDAFNKNNPFGIEVSAVSKGGYDQVFEAMTAGIQTGELPEIVVAYINQAAAYQNNSALVDMNPMFNDAVIGIQDYADDMYTAFFDADLNPSHGNARLSLSTYRSIELLYYNVDALKALGYNAPPKTWAEFGEMACKYVEGDKATRDGYQIRTDASFIAAGAFAAGGDVYDAATGMFTYDSEAALLLPTEIQALLNKGCIKKTVDPKARSDQASFANGASIFYTGSSSGIPFIWDAISKAPTKFTFDVAAIPGTLDKPVVNVYGASNSLVGLKKSKEQILASWLFLRWFSEAGPQAQWVEGTNYFPVRRSVAANLEAIFAKEGTGQAFKTAFSLLESNKAEPAVDVYQTVRSEVAKAFNNILDGADVKEEMTRVNEVANKLLEESQAKK